VPKIKNIIDFTGKTTITEALEITKKAKCYVGIDSFSSTLAMQIFKKDLFVVKYF
jgi:ADP-heptose:LPS heptosyltransferase